MASPKFIMPRIRAADPITASDGKAVNAFVRFWDTICRQIEGQENNQNTLLASVQQILAQQSAQLAIINQALELAGLALETADGGSANKSGSDVGGFSLSGTGTSVACQVDLTGVAAGDLTVPGTGPSVIYGTSSMSGGTVSYGEYDIVEVSGGDTIVFTGTFNVTDVTGDEPSQVFQMDHTSAPDIAAFTSARTSTGAVSYRIDIRRLSGATMLGLRFYLFARRAV